MERIATDMTFEKLFTCQHLFLLHTSIQNMDNTIDFFRHFTIVRYHNNSCILFFVQFYEKLHNILRCLRIKSASRFIGNNKLRVINNCSGNSYVVAALLTIYLVRDSLYLLDRRHEVRLKLYFSRFITQTIIN